MLHVPGLYIAPSDHGRGVFCGHDISQNDIIEVCPVVKIPTGQLQYIDKTIVYEYYFLWEEAGYDACMALGYGSLYNHHLQANTEVIMDYGQDQICLKAKTDIPSGVELLIDYTGGTKGEVELWF